MIFYFYSVIYRSWSHCERTAEIYTYKKKITFFHAQLQDVWRRILVLNLLKIFHYKHLLLYFFKKEIFLSIVTAWKHPGHVKWMKKFSS